MRFVPPEVKAKKTGSETRDGIVTISMDMEGAVNAMNEQYRQAMAIIPTRLEAEEGLTGVILTSPS